MTAPRTTLLAQSVPRRRVRAFSPTTPACVMTRRAQPCESTNPDNPGPMPSPHDIPCVLNGNLARAACRTTVHALAFARNPQNDNRVQARAGLAYRVAYSQDGPRGSCRSARAEWRTVRPTTPHFNSLTHRHRAENTQHFECRAGRALCGRVACAGARGRTPVQDLLRADPARAWTLVGGHGSCVLIFGRMRTHHGHALPHLPPSRHR